MRYWILMAAVLFAVQLVGCKQPVAIDQEHEIQIGQNAAKELEAKTGVWDNQEQTARLQRIGASIVGNTERQDLPWSFKILDDEQINAMALPGGFVYVTRGLIESGADDQKLAGVTAHEIAHVTRKHAVKIMEKALTASIIVEIVTKDSSEDIQKASDIALDLAIRSGYRDEEYDADKVGTRFAFASGHEVEGLLNFLRDIREREGRDPSQLETWISTHPPTSKRIQRLEEFIPTLTSER